jgi:hypothetical protein
MNELDYVELGFDCAGICLTGEWVERNRVNSASPCVIQ